MASPFDSAWALPDSAAVVEMGEAVYFGKAAQELTVVVSEVEQAPGRSGPVMSAGTAYQVHLSRAQLDTLIVDDAARGALALLNLRVKRGANGVTAVVLSVQDLGGAGAVLICGSTAPR